MAQALLIVIVDLSMYVATISNQWGDAYSTSTINLTVRVSAYDKKLT